MVKIVAGLGNPGNKYSGTRHNVGFRVIEELASRFATGRPRSNFQGEAVDVRIGDERAVLLTPHTYMNRSGASVLAARDFYKVETDDLLVICDDFQLPLGRLRIRKQGSAGGQKGLDDVIRRLGTQQVPRLRIGIGDPPDGWDVADYVLSKFSRQEAEAVELAIVRAADATEMWAKEGIDACMNQYNRDSDAQI